MPRDSASRWEYFVRPISRRRLARFSLVLPALVLSAAGIRSGLDGLAMAHLSTPAASEPASPAACLSPTQGTPSASPIPEAVVKMTAQIRFEPARLEIRVGETVTWLNAGTIPHTSTDDPTQNPVAVSHPEYAQRPPGAAPWNSGLLQQGQSFSHAFLVPGEYHYFCIPHVLSGMRGTVIVTC